MEKESRLCMNWIAVSHSPLDDYGIPLVCVCRTLPRNQFSSFNHRKLTFLFMLFPCIPSPIYIAFSFHRYQTKGHMERTIEILLMEESGLSVEEVPPPAVQHGQRDNTIEPQSEHQFRHNLAPDFLVMAAAWAAAEGRTSQEQYSPNQTTLQNDEILARQLQRELYQEALQDQHREKRRHKRREVAASPQEGSPVFLMNPPTGNRSSRRRSQNIQGPVNQSGGYGSNNAQQSGTQPSSSVKAKLSNLSEAAKKRLADFKKKFTSKKKSEYSRQGLLDQADEDLPHNQL